MREEKRKYEPKGSANGNGSALFGKEKFETRLKGRGGKEEERAESKRERRTSKKTFPVFFTNK